MNNENNKTETVSRRKVLLGLAAAGAGAAIAGTVKANPPDLEAQRQRLLNVLNHVEISNDLIQGAAERWVDPSEPSRPAIETLLGTISTECTSVIDIAHELLLRRAG